MTSEPGTAPSDLYRDQLLDAILTFVPRSGWTPTALSHAAKKLGLSKGQVLLSCPNGVLDLLELLGKRAAKAAGERLGQPDVAGMKVREKVATAVRAYLAFLEPHKAAMKRAVVSPANILAGPQGIWESADAIWAGLGDKSTDYNWYTKRAILSGVIASTVIAWVGTDDEAEVNAFIDRRIENVMHFEKFKSQVKDMAAKMPNPLDLMGKQK
jgi:ubiquinone biosynthesis protein COQ9